MKYSAKAVIGPARHGERVGIEVSELDYVGRQGWADRGVIFWSGPMRWDRWQPDLADRWLDDMGWARVADWVEGGGAWFAQVVERSLTPKANDGPGTSKTG